MRRTLQLAAFLIAVASASAQTPTTNATGQTTPQDFVVHVYFNGQEFQTLSDKIAALTAGNASFASQITAQMQNNTAAFQTATAQNILQMANNVAALNALGGIHQQSANSLGQIATILQTMGPAYAQMVPALDNLRMSVNAWNSKAGDYVTAVNALGGTVNTLGQTVNTAITTGSTLAANAFNTGVVPKLDAISNILLTNNFGGTNSISINSTNGDVNVTNNVIIPDLFRLREAADLTMFEAGKLTPLMMEAYSGSGIMGNNPPTPTQFVPATVVPVQAVAINPGFSADFLRVRIPMPRGESDQAKWTIDMNPITTNNGQFAGVFAWFRTACAWLFTVLFIRKNLEIAEKYLIAKFTVPQFQAPNVQVAGNSVGKLSIAAYYSIFVALSVTFVTAMETYLTGAMALSLPAEGMGWGTNIVATVGALRRDVFVGLSPDVVLLLDHIFPLVMMVSQALWLATSRLWLVSVWFVYAFSVRKFLPI